MNHEVTLVTSTGHFDITIDDDLMSRMGVTTTNFETCKLFVSTWLALLSDSPLNPTDKPKRLYQRFISTMIRNGLKQTVVDYSNLSHELVSRHTLMGSDPERGHWIGDMFKNTPVFFEYNRYYQTGDASLIDFLYTFLNFGKKLSYEEKDFESIAFRDWEAVEKRLADLTYEKIDLQNMKVILSTVLPSLTFPDFWPKFGPGSVAERGIHGRHDKLSILSSSHVLDLLFYPKLMFRGEHYFADKRRYISTPCHRKNGGRFPKRTSLQRFVPKNMKTARSIGMEPNDLMYHQQGVMHRVLELIGSSVFGNFIDIKDQTKNQNLAYLGSCDGEIDTIDLSAASDSVGVDLVKGIFPLTWLPPMLCTRSTQVVVPGGSIRKLKKFAPMGSALCFPTQCIIFAAVCIYAAYQYRTDRDEHHIPQKVMRSVDVSRTIDMFLDTPYKFFKPLAIYGDDICCDRRITPYVMSILSRLGFVVNTSKSFMGSQSFRESCGKFYLAGRDITPLYFRVKGVRKRHLTASHIASEVHTINECLVRGYVNTRRFLIKSLREWNGGIKPPIPFITDDSQFFGIKVFGVPYNEHLKHRYSKRYQRAEISVWTCSYKSQRSSRDIVSLDRYEYMRWWACRSSTYTSADSQAASRIDYDGVSIRRRWIPLS